MKSITLVLFLTLAIKTTLADCVMSGIWFYPETKEIGLNSMFVIEGFAANQKTINTFKARKIYLESKNGERIELVTKEILKGQMQLTQAILCAARELKPNTTYFLKYANQTEKETNDLQRWNSDKKAYEKIFWKTTNKKSISLINLNLNPEFEKTDLIHFGCGPSAKAIFNTNNKLNAQIWYRTEVVDLTTKKKTIFYIKERNGQLHVGHDMCGGAFTFNKKGKYKARFTPISTDGKLLKTTDWKTFESPFMNDESFFVNSNSE